MDTQTAQRCLSAAYEGTLDFPTIVGALIGAGFEGYTVDYRRHTSTYHLPSGQSLELPLPQQHGEVSATFDAQAIAAAIRDAQTLAPGYTYAGFCQRVTAAGCAGYMVSFLGRRVVYFGRTAEIHTEHFPQ
jgi:uncharacterized protein YbcV (DUF1398 family)